MRIDTLVKYVCRIYRPRPIITKRYRMKHQRNSFFDTFRFNYCVLLAQLLEHSNYGEDDNITARRNMQADGN